MVHLELRGFSQEKSGSTTASIQISETTPMTFLETLKLLKEDETLKKFFDF